MSRRASNWATMCDATVDFSVLCNMFDSIAKSKKPLLMRKHLRTFLEQVYTDHEYFSALRLILPHLDNSRPTYGVKETVMGKYLAEALGLAKESADSQKLLNWRKGGTRVGNNAGNFASVAIEILHSRQRVTSKGLKIKDVNNLLDRLAVAQKREEKVAVFADMISKTNAQEMRWIIVIILKDLKLGMSEKTVFREFHPDAEDMFNVRCILQEVCETLHNRSERFIRTAIEVGRAVRPQLAGRVPSVEAAWKKFRGKKVTVECKFDGDRIQIHKAGKQFYFFSRNFIDHQQFKEGMADVLLQNVLPDKCILDGEMLVWDRATNRFAEFGSNREAAKAAKDGLETTQQLCYVAFDLLYDGSGSVIHLPLFKRQELLHSAVRPLKGRLELLPTAGHNNMGSLGEPQWSIVATSAAEVERFFRETVENREEGIILKDLDSQWEPSDRGDKWLKLKPDYVNTGSDLDVLIIGGYYGSGRRGGQVAQFLLGIAEKPKASEYPTKFLSFCKVGTGLTDAECDHLVQKLNPYFRRNEKNSKPPDCYIVTNNAKERPDVWVDPPDKSVIMEVKSDIRTISTDVFAAPYGLRFPRVNRVRYEKPWYDCLDKQTLVDMVHSTDRSTVDVNGYAKIEKKSKQNKRQKRPNVRILPLVPSHMQVTDVSGVKRTSQIFEDLVFYFVNNPEGHSKESLHKLVTENGGCFSMNLSDDVTHAIASERKGIKFQAAIAHGDVIHYSWIIDCFTGNALLPVRPKYFLHLSQQTKEKMRADVDDYGDYYFVDIDTSDLSQLFENLDPAKMATDCDELEHYQKKYCPSSPLCKFANFKFYFHKPIHSSNPDSQAVAEITLKRQELDIIMHAGTVCETLSRAVTHMIVYRSSEHLPFRTIVKSISPRDRRLLMSHKLKILSHQWLDDHEPSSCDHPAETEYDLRDSTFRFNEQEVDMGVGIQPDERQEVDGSWSTRNARDSNEHPADLAKPSELPAQQAAAMETVSKNRKRLRGDDNQTKVKGTPVDPSRGKAVKAEHTVESAEIFELPKKRMVTVEKPPKRQHRGSSKLKAVDGTVEQNRGKAEKIEDLSNLAGVLEHPRKRLVTLEKPPKQGKHLRSHDIVKPQDKAPQARKATEREGVVETKPEPTFKDQSVEMGLDNNSPQQAKGTFGDASREDVILDSPVAPSSQRGTDSTFDALIGELFPSFNPSQQLPSPAKNIEVAGLPTIEKTTFTPALAETSSLQNPAVLQAEVQNFRTENFTVQAPAATAEPTNKPPPKKKVSYKNLVGNLLNRQ